MIASLSVLLGVATGLAAIHMLPNLPITSYAIAAGTAAIITRIGTGD